MLLACMYPPGDMVRFHTEGAIRSKLSANYEIPPELPLQDFALHWIQKQPGVDSVLVGLPRQSHAQEALKLVKK
jgi:aryl-alcohol dehydrogenase-like predicted oxidoreductase